MRVIITASSDSGPLGKRWVRDGQQIVIGRTEQADWMIPEPSISSRHCIFRCQRGQASVEDLKSTNGTWVGDERVDMCEIDGDQAIRIGSVTLSVRLENRLPEKPIAQASPSDDVPTTEPVLPAKKSAPLPATPAATPTAAHTGSIRLVAMTRQNHSRRMTLRFGQQAVLGRSDQVEFPMINDHSLAAEQLSIRFEAGFCVVSILAEEPPTFLGEKIVDPCDANGSRRSNQGR